MLRAFAVITTRAPHLLVSVVFVTIEYRSSLIFSIWTFDALGGE